MVDKAVRPPADRTAPSNRTLSNTARRARLQRLMPAQLACGYRARLNFHKSSYDR